MNTPVMTERTKESSLRLMARIAGALYLITILTGILSAGYGGQHTGAQRHVSAGFRSLPH